MFFPNLPSNFSYNKFLWKLQNCINNFIHQPLTPPPPPSSHRKCRGVVNTRYSKDVNNNGNNNRDVTATRRQKRLKEIRSPENVACTCNICSTQHAQYFQAMLSSYNILWRITFSTDTERNTINFFSSDRKWKLSLSAKQEQLRILIKRKTFTRKVDLEHQSHYKGKDTQYKAEKLKEQRIRPFLYPWMQKREVFRVSVNLKE